MKRYSKYKDSGIECLPAEKAGLGQIPEHWEVKRVKDVFSQMSNSGSKLKPDSYIPLENIESFTGKLIKKASNDNNEITNLFTKDDLLLNKLRPYLGKVYLADFDGGVSGEVIVLRQKRQLSISTKYYLYRFLSIHFIGKINSLTDGVKMPRTNPNKILVLEIGNPPVTEQTAIAHYLDNKTQAIDQRIALLEKKIGYYKELRRSLINETVTKGLDRNVRLKDSGIDYIGQIPEHWEVKRLKELGKIETSSVNKKIEEEEALVKLVNYIDVYNNPTKEIWNRDNYMVVSANKLQVQSKNLKRGDVLFTPSSETIEDIGVSAIVMENLVNTLYSYHTLRFRFSKNIDLDFKKYMFNNDFVQYYFSNSATGTTRKILGLNTFYNLPVLLPPSEKEQFEIASFLNIKSNTIDKVVSNIQSQISKLKELRKTLINDVVTGKIRVSDDY